jgi:hypothetical protein
MNFKPPRDPNTKSGLETPLRRMGAHEGWPCHVGGGECREPAVEAHDDYSGGEFLVCAKHLPEVHALGKLIAEMTENEMAGFKAAVDEAEGVV